MMTNKQMKIANLLMRKTGVASFKATLANNIGSCQRG